MTFQSISMALRKKPALRKLIFWSWIAFWLVVGIVGLELLSRQYLGVWHREISYRYLQPYLMSGGYVESNIPELVDYDVMMGHGSPEAFGYQRQGGMYVYGFDSEISSLAQRGEFLFQDRVEMANDTSNHNVIRVFVIGGSAAYGIGASSKEKRWYVVLERLLTETLNHEVRLIPAAMVGYVTSQERIVLDMMVLPRKPDAVVILNGFNDAALPYIFGSRPGDPYDMGILYINYYSPLFGFKKWLADRSHLFLSFMHRSLANTLYENEKRILNDPQLLSNHVRSTA